MILKAPEADAFLVDGNPNYGSTCVLPKGWQRIAVDKATVVRRNYKISVEYHNGYFASLCALGMEPNMPTLIGGRLIRWEELQTILDELINGIST
jgi:hypothetical protein